MSRRIVGYEGEGKHRRPIYSDPLAVDLSINPPGPVERRVTTDAEREGFAPRIQGAGLVRLPRRAASVAAAPPAPRPAVTDAERMQASRMRGAARHVEVVTGRKPASPALEEPVMSEPITAPEPAGDLPWITPELRLPCDGCAHVPVCALRVTLEPLAFRVSTIAEIDPALHLVAAIDVACDHRLPIHGGVTIGEQARIRDRATEPTPAARIAAFAAEQAERAPEAGGGSGVDSALSASDARRPGGGQRRRPDGGRGDRDQGDLVDRNDGSPPEAPRPDRGRTGRRGEEALT